jgi:alpha,alpha-trehalase
MRQLEHRNSVLFCKRGRKSEFVFHRRAFRLASQACLIFAIAYCVLAQEDVTSRGTPQGAQSQGSPEGHGLTPILTYISTSWDTLTRSMTECKSLVDPKVNAAAILYLPAAMEEPAAVRKLESECKVEIRHLPIEIHRLGEIDTNKLQPPGLLYLENKYVVPGGRFNEMYGWDS